jgi:Homing endonuclease associated repeat/HNH endonuclease
VPDAADFRFELDRLVSYDDADLIAELQRVSALVPGEALTRAGFDGLAKVNSGTITRRFGTWREALAAADLAQRYGGRTVSQRMRAQPARGITTGQMLAELKRVAGLLGATGLSRTQFDEHAAAVKASAIERRFGSWIAGLREAGLSPLPGWRRWSDDDYFENMLAVWTAHGRAPYHSEMNQPPSRISSGAYEHKWGTWNKARLAFLNRVNRDVEADPAPPPSSDPVRPATSQTRTEANGSVRSVSIGLRYEVLRRDRFRCVLCGASPATDLGCTLHVDHTVPVARGGKTTADNLRSLCQSCNLGKGSKVE